jgi:hypothetical protein
VQRTVPDDPVPDPREEQVRRLLADARHTEPVPDDVAARLDAVLTDLGRSDGPLGEQPAPPAGPRATTDQPADQPADQLAAARRRRNVRTWLVAAAAVVAVGIGIGQLDLGSGSGEDSSAGGSSADTGTSTRRAPSAAEAAPAFPPDAVRLHADGFARDVRRLAGLAAPGGSSSGDLTPGPARGACRPRPPGVGRSLAVRYDGAPGVLVLRPPRGDSRVVDLYLCGGADPVRSITLPAR